LKGNWIGSIVYNHAGGKYGLATKTPYSSERPGFFITDDQIAEDIIPINIDKIREERIKMRLSAVSLLVGLLLLLTCSPQAMAEQGKRSPRIGLLLVEASSRFEAFRKGLETLGYIEGQNVELDCRLTGGKYEALHQLIIELIARRVDVIVTGGNAATQAAKNATTTIPIVFGSASDPLGSGLVVSLARPGGNVTGLSLQSRELTAKRFEILHEVISRTNRVAILFTPDSNASVMQFKETQAVAQTTHIALQPLEVRTPKEFETAFATAIRGRADALLVVQSTFTLAHKSQLATLASQHRLPTLYGSSEFVEVGGLMSYGPDALDMYRRAASYVDRILKGAKPGDLPVEQLSKFEFAVNLKTAKSLGLTLSPSVFIRVDRMIE
jgi:putative ABC transport system substrate-binding protein